jgi:hypothetical protein
MGRSYKERAAYIPPLRKEDAMAEGLIMGDVVRNDLVRYEELSVMHFRALDALNVREFAPRGPGVYALAHTAPHDEQRVQPPYHFGRADDLSTALSSHLHESDPGLAAHAVLGNRWFRVVSADAGNIDTVMEALKAQYSA